jgi:hypothetical protein
MPFQAGPGIRGINRKGVIMKVCTLFLAVFIMGGVSFFSAAFPGTGDLFAIRSAFAEEDWKKEFDDVCSKTQDTLEFTDDELRSLVDRCDKLKPLIESLDETQKKVYLKRLAMCRNLFEFMLKSRQKK